MHRRREPPFIRSEPRRSGDDFGGLREREIAAPETSREHAAPAADQETRARIAQAQRIAGLRRRTGVQIEIIENEHQFTHIAYVIGAWD